MGVYCYGCDSAMPEETPGEVFDEGCRRCGCGEEHPATSQGQYIAELLDRINQLEDRINHFEQKEAGLI